jgi:uncharacterized protein YggE
MARLVAAKVYVEVNAVFRAASCGNGQPAGSLLSPKEPFMRLFPLVVAAALVGGPALAQSVTLSDNARFQKAPWWMDQPIIASTGYVETEVRANRARAAGSFQVVAKTAPEATRQAADKVRALGQALAAYGAEKVRVETTFSMRPIYEQYRDREGNLIANQRADRIDSYEVNANVAIEVRDVALAERIYATLLAARPTSTEPVYFNLDPESATRTELYSLAVADAARRARLSVDATGARLGPVKLIDPTGRACGVDVLVTGAPAIYGGGVMAEGVTVTGRIAGMAPLPAPPPPPRAALAPRAPGGDTLRPEDMQLPLQPPLQKLEAQACVVYALG